MIYVDFLYCFHPSLQTLDLLELLEFQSNATQQKLSPCGIAHRMFFSVLNFTQLALIAGKYFIKKQFMLNVRNHKGK